MLDSVDVYDPAADTWSASLPLPTPRGDCRAETLGGQVFVVGGVPLQPDVEVYDPGTLFVHMKD